jgi:hypothetical protein
VLNAWADARATGDADHQKVQSLSRMGVKRRWWKVAVRREQRGRRCCSVRSGRTMEGSAILTNRWWWFVNESGRPARRGRWNIRANKRVA